MTMIRFCRTTFRSVLLLFYISNLMTFPATASGGDENTTTLPNSATDLPTPSSSSASSVSSTTATPAVDSTTAPVTRTTLLQTTIQLNLPNSMAPGTNTTVLMTSSTTPPPTSSPTLPLSLSPSTLPLSVDSTSASPSSSVEYSKTEKSSTIPVASTSTPLDKSQILTTPTSPPEEPNVPSTSKTLSTSPGILDATTRTPTAPEIATESVPDEGASQSDSPQTPLSTVPKISLGLSQSKLLSGISMPSSTVPPASPASPDGMASTLSHKTADEQFHGSSVTLLVYFFVAVVIFIGCYVVYHNRLKLRISAQKVCRSICQKRTEGRKYRPLPVLIGEQELSDIKGYVY